VSLAHIVEMMTLVQTVATVTLDTTVDFVTPLVALLKSWPVMWRKEHLWNSNVLKGVHNPTLFIFSLNDRKMSDITGFQGFHMDPLLHIRSYSSSG
jgi:hypothetical protein